MPTQSHTISELSCSPIAFDNRRPLSQYCCTRESDVRLIVKVEGEIQSLGSTGSQTTKTRRLSPLCPSKTRCTAEAPCRQIIQVGERSAMTRTVPRAVLKSLRSSSKSPAVSETSGCCPAGVALPP